MTLVLELVTVSINDSDADPCGVLGAVLILKQAELLCLSCFTAPAVSAYAQRAALRRTGGNVGWRTLLWTPDRGHAPWGAGPPLCEECHA